MRGGTLHRHGHARPGPDAEVGQSVRQTVGPPIELVVGCRAPVPRQRRRLRIFRDACLEDLGDRRLSFVGRGRTRQRHYHVALLHGQHGNLRQSCRGVAEEHFEQLEVAVEHRLGGGLVEQVGAVLPHDAQRPRVRPAVHDDDVQIRLRRAVAHGVVGHDGDPGKIQVDDGRVLEREQDLVQRRRAGLTRGAHRFQHIFERQVLMGERIQGRLPHTGKVVRPRWGRRSGRPAEPPCSAAFR